MRDIEKLTLVAETHKLLKDNAIQKDVLIYFKVDNQWYRMDCDTGLIEYSLPVSEYFDYYNEDTISMSFEGGLYHALNGYTLNGITRKLEKLFDKYGLYYELGNAWNLTLYEN